jgi:ADP-heptose:LPS heptosyltransferase
LIRLRFSSIGDVVLTTPVLRALKNQLNCELHYITKKAFAEILEHNPSVDKIYTIDKSINEVITELKAEHYDFVIDLHKNVRTLSLKRKLGCKSYSFPKLNRKKWLLVNFKRASMPDKHVVDRYFETVKPLGVVNDDLPCDYYIQAQDEVNVTNHFGLEQKSFVTLAIGAQFATKRMSFQKLQGIIRQIEKPIILVGGPTDRELADKIVTEFPSKQLFSACGNYTLSQSASIVKQSSVILTNDTGMMHIASCFQVPTVSVWGNTVPELGMYPYFPQNKDAYSIHEVKGLHCRPCSKIGFNECPKRHFNCMQLQDESAIAQDVNQRS